MKINYKHMKKITLTTLLIISFVYFGNAQNLSAFFYTSNFTTPENNPYIETYISIAGNTAAYALSDNKTLQATVEVTIIFKQDSVIKEYRKYNLKSPELPDTTLIFPSFIDLQRIPLKNGSYNFELYLKDLNAENPKVFKHFDVITIDFPEEKLAFSDIEIVEEFQPTRKQTIFTKNDYNLIPYVSNFFPLTVEKMNIYAEIYNMDKAIGMDEGFLIQYYFETYPKKAKLKEFTTFQKQLASPINIIMKGMSLSKLPSGNYNLVIELRNKKNEVLKTKKLFFQRSNPEVDNSYDNITNLDLTNTFAEKITNIDSLALFIQYLRPISDNVETTYSDNQLKAAEIVLMQKYFYNFWKKRSADPENEWELYLQQVNFVNKSFGTQIKKGFETDRGRVYLQYGTPNSVADSKFESHYLPYEIWQYYETNGQRNVKFVFYKSSHGLDEYVILHSTAKGEIINKNWKSLIGASSPEEDGDNKVGNDFDLVR